MKKNRLPNVLLTIPKYASTPICGYVMPLGILYVSASLKKAKIANVYTVNLNHQDDVRYTLKTMIKDHDIDIIGTGGISGEFTDIIKVFQIAKSIKKDIVTVVGGGLITSDPQVAMEALEIVDYGVIGEGDAIVSSLIHAIWKNENINNINNIIFHTENGFLQTLKKEENINLDTLPIPDYKGFDYDKYLEMNTDFEDGIYYSQVAIIGGRSCKYNCTFCFHPTGSLYRQRSLDSIFNELDYLTQNYSINYVALREELFSSDSKRVLDFCERIKNYDLVWSIQLRVDSISEEMVAMLKKSNCRYIFLGIESADNRILKSMRKQITIEQVEHTLQMTSDIGLDTRSTIIIGDAVETIDSANRTLSWWNKHKKDFAISLDLIIAFPGSTLYKNACKSGRISDPIQFLKDGCPIINLSTEMSDEEFLSLTHEVSSHNGIEYTVYNYNLIKK